MRLVESSWALTWLVVLGKMSVQQWWWPSDLQVPVAALGWKHQPAIQFARASIGPVTQWAQDKMSMYNMYIFILQGCLWLEGGVSWKMRPSMGCNVTICDPCLLSEKSRNWRAKLSISSVHMYLHDTYIHNTPWHGHYQAAMNGVPVRRQSAIPGWWCRMLLIIDNIHPSWKWWSPLISTTLYRPNSWTCMRYMFKSALRAPFTPQLAAEGLVEERFSSPQRDAMWPSRRACCRCSLPFQKMLTLATKRIWAEQVPLDSMWMRLPKDPFTLEPFFQEENVKPGAAWSWGLFLYQIVPV